MSVFIHRKLILLIFNSALLFWTTSGCGQNTSIHVGALYQNGEPFGTAFVLGKQKDIVSNWHNLEWARTNIHATNVFFVNGNGKHSLTVKRELPNYDLVTFTSNPTIESDGYPAGDFGNIKPGDWVSYMGLDYRLTTNISHPVGLISDGIVQRKQPHKTGKVDTLAIMFVGAGIFGYSGAPVFTTNSGKVEIIAILSQCGIETTYNGIKGRVNIAYTIAPLLDVETNNQPSTLKPSATPKK